MKGQMKTLCLELIQLNTLLIFQSHIDKIIVLHVCHA